MCAYEWFPASDVAEPAQGCTICPTVTPATAATCKSMRARVCVSMCGVGVSDRHLAMCASLHPPPPPHYNVWYGLRDLIWRIGFVVWAISANQISLAWWRGGTASGGSWLALSGWDQPSRLVFENEWYPVWVVAAEERISVAFTVEVKF